MLWVPDRVSSQTHDQPWSLQPPDPIGRSDNDLTIDVEAKRLPVLNRLGRLVRVVSGPGRRAHFAGQRAVTDPVIRQQKTCI